MGADQIQSPSSAVDQILEGKVDVELPSGYGYYIETRQVARGPPSRSVAG
jgi:hypothetical protein